ncbi:DUF2470 domain-containing protein [Streptomyces sp. NBC_01190]|uniref:DUF2470 domain-containing protein n=1 Tax=Streptomyces sp. NBC_01190 TaxID=2903767 RepID=UPI00386EBDF6|nr:DUF2470 domain-containing protein [Streptomyces sp. NBC_01190]
MEEAPQQPSAAERARTLVEGNPSLALAIPGLDTPDSALDALNALNALDGPLTPLRHSVGPAGDVFLLFARDAPAVRAVRAAENAAAGGADEVAAVLEITDVAPVAVPHRIRGRAWIAGWLTRVPGGAYEAGTELLRLEPGEISVDDLWGTEVVEPDEFADAVADPLAGHETEVLQHLAAVHAAEVGLLCGLVAASGRPAVDGGDCSPRAALAAVPLGLDRFGLRVRFTAEQGVFDARFDFPEPVADMAGARRGVRALFAAAREG